eukprot:9151411-Pyramimonas_sp.AAC.1
MLSLMSSPARTPHGRRLAVRRRCDSRRPDSASHRRGGFAPHRKKVGLGYNSKTFSGGQGRPYTIYGSTDFRSTDDLTLFVKAQRVRACVWA